MSNSEDLQSCRYKVSHGDDGALTLHIQGRMDAATAAAIWMISEHWSWSN
jgi:hypothetical protein